jgi:hypothetical protein
MESYRINYEINCKEKIDEIFEIINELIFFNKSDENNNNSENFIEIYDNILLSIFFKLFKINLDETNLAFTYPKEEELEKIKYIIKNFSIQELSYITLRVCGRTCVDIQKGYINSEKNIYNHAFYYSRKLKESNSSLNINWIDKSHEILNCRLNKYFFKIFFNVDSERSLKKVISMPYCEIIKEYFNIDIETNYYDINKLEDSSLNNFWVKNNCEKRISNKNFDYWRGKYIKN